uniref:Uncharacterized protein n=1 Tax=Corvus moneduloides TaxID=1196302 RepID=A0A8C3GTX0_CORMO
SGTPKVVPWRARTHTGSWDTGGWCALLQARLPHSLKHQRRAPQPQCSSGCGHTEGRCRRPRPGAMHSGRCGRRPSAPVPPRRAVPSAVCRCTSAVAGGGGARQGPGRAAMSPPVAAARSGPALPAQAALVRAFPVAAVQLSAFPVCQWLQQLCLELHTECLAVTAARKATGAGTESHRQELLAVLRDLITPDLLPQLHLHWLLEDGIWATHREGSCGESSDCFMELEVVIQGFSQIFSAGLSLDSCITTVAQHYKDSLRPFSVSIRQSLSDICTEAAARLCLTELAVVQKSMQLIGTGYSVQILEDACPVGIFQEGPSSYTCYFNQTFQLPCWHILAVLLNSNRKPLQREMLSRAWERGCDHQRSWSKSLDISLVVSFLTAEISQLPATVVRSLSTGLCGSWLTAGSGPTLS